MNNTARTLVTATYTIELDTQHAGRVVAQIVPDTVTRMNDGTYRLEADRPHTTTECTRVAWYVDRNGQKLP